MSAAANVAAILVAMIPAQAQDRPFVSSITDRGTVSVAEVSAYEEGRLLPKRVTGYPAWRCSRGEGRRIACSISRQTAAFRVVAAYRVAGGRSVTRVVVRAVAR